MKNLCYNLMVLSLLSSSAMAKSPTAYIGYAYPAGGKAGTTFTIEVGGQYLESADQLIFSDKNITGKIVDYRKVLNRRDAQQQKRNIDVLKGRLEIAKTEKEKQIIQTRIDKTIELVEMQDPILFQRSVPAEIREQEAKQQFNPQLSERVFVEVNAGKSVEDGRYEFRVLTKEGVSNPISFYVGGLNEANEVEPNDDHFTSNLDLIQMPVCLNGQILPGDIDHFRFAAKKGDAIVINAFARRITPYLSDAVPGWFQSTLSLFDSNGKEISFVDDYKFSPDPIIFFDVPEDGEYTLQIRDALYRGREDFCYRISIGKLPFITSTFPLGWQHGKDVKVQLNGKNLPASSVSSKSAKGDGSLKKITVSNGDVHSNVAPFAVSENPEIFEAEPNDGSDKFQKVVLPVVINGKIEKSGDNDVFAFTGKAGEKVAIEITARRLKSPLDSVVRLYDKDFKELAKNDDFVDSGSGLTTHHADSYLVHELPADGEYFVVLSDTQHSGSDEHAYRLRIAEATPDFALQVEPSAIKISAGGTGIFTARVLRKDGFDGAIELLPENLPSGFSVSKSSIAAGKDSAIFTVTAGERFSGAEVAPKIYGVAKIGAKTVRREATAVNDQMQAYLYRHLVPSDELLFVPAEAEGFSFKFDTRDKAVELPLNKEVWIRAEVKWNKKSNRFYKFVLENPPKGIEVIKGGISARQERISLCLKATEPLEAGFEDSLIIKAEAKIGKETKQVLAPAFKIRVVE